MMKYFCITLLLFELSGQIFAQKYVATDGDDANPGTVQQPFKSITKAISVAVPGDTIYVRGGAYSLSSAINIESSKSGSDSSGYCLFAYRDERPLLDFSSSALGAKGISLKASYWHFKGIDVKGAGDNGLEINGGSHNIIQFCSFYENRDSGVQLSNGASHNQIINCDSYYNADPPDYADADGFAPKLAVGNGNYFYGCRAWGNCDDGWDGYLRGANDVTTTLENCWTWGNGYMKDGTDPGSQANGNGFKIGGGDNSNSEQLMHHFILKNCLAFENKAKGFDQNNNMGSMALLNCSGYHNLAANYRITRALNSGQLLTVKNCVSFSGAVEFGTFAIQETNSWLAPFIVTAEDFLSLNSSSASTPRNADGTLPDIDFMRLAAGSDLIDAGIDLGLPYNGNGPDLGAFETDFNSYVEADGSRLFEFRLHQNYPNPFNPSTTIRFKSPGGFVSLAIFNISGQAVAALENDYVPAGDYEITWQPAPDLSGGLYFCKLQVDDFSEIKKLIFQK